MVKRNILLKGYYGIEYKSDWGLLLVDILAEIHKNYIYLI